MIVGLVLIVLTVALAAFAVAFNGSPSPDHTITLFGQYITTATAPQIFLGGIALGVLFCIGVWIVSVAGRRRRAMRAEFRAARRERDDLAEQLTQQETLHQETLQENTRREPVVATESELPKHAVEDHTVK